MHRPRSESHSHILIINTNVDLLYTWNFTNKLLNIDLFQNLFYCLWVQETHDTNPIVLYTILQRIPLHFQIKFPLTKYLLGLYLYLLPSKIPGTVLDDEKRTFLPFLAHPLHYVKISTLYVDFFY